MRNLVVGIVVGLVVGIVVGTTIIAPRLKLPAHKIMARQSTPVAPSVAIQEPTTLTRAAAERPAQPSSPGSQPTLTWRMASAYASALPQLGEQGVRFETTLWHLSAGTMRVKLHEPGTLVAADDMFNAVRSAAIEAAFAAPSFWADKNPAFQLFSAIPFGPPLPEYLSWMFDGGGLQILQDLYAKQGLRGLVCGVLAPEGSGWFRQPVDNINDFKALRLGMGGLGGKVAAKLGANTMTLAEGDVFVALEKGLIDGAEASQPAVDLELGLHQLARHYYFPGWHQPATLLHLIVNLDLWNGLPKSRRSQIEAACRDNISHGLAVGEARQFGALKELVRQGVKIEIWAPDILAALKAAWAQVLAEEKNNNRDFKRAWESLQAFREEYGIWREISEGTPASRRLPISEPPTPKSWRGAPPAPHSDQAGNRSTQAGGRP